MFDNDLFDVNCLYRWEYGPTWTYANYLRTYELGRDGDSSTGSFRVPYTAKHLMMRDNGSYIAINRLQELCLG